MSSTLNVYAVPLERLRQVMGSGDQDLITAIKASQSSLLASVDEIDDEAGFTCAEAVADLVNGNASKAHPSYFYGYAMEAICNHLGKALPSLSGISGVPDWVDEVTANLGTLGVPLDLNELVYGGSPVRIPSPDDYPFIGHLEPDTLASAQAAFQGKQIPEEDEDLPQIREWLDEAVKIPGAALVGFVS